MFRSLQRAAHSAEVNCGPLSLVIVDGTQNRCIQPVNSAAAQSAAAAAAAAQECVPVPVLRGAAPFLADSPCRSEPPP